MIESFNGSHVDRFSYCSRMQRLQCNSLEDLRRAVGEARTPITSRRDVQEAEDRGVPVRGVLRRALIDEIPGFEAFEFGASAPCWGKAKVPGNLIKMMQSFSSLSGHDVLTGIFKECSSINLWKISLHFLKHLFDKNFLTIPKRVIVCRISQKITQ